MRKSFDSPVGAPGPRRTLEHRTDNSPGGHTKKVRSGRRVEPNNWRDLANCRGRMELFFAKRAERPEARARREAKALTLCGQCCVAEACREFARQHHEYGFWAGESEEDRHVLGFTVSAPIGTRARSHDPVRRNGTAG